MEAPETRRCRVGFATHPELRVLACWQNDGLGDKTLARAHGKALQVGEPLISKPQTGENCDFALVLPAYPDFRALAFEV